MFENILKPTCKPKYHTSIVTGKRGSKQVVLPPESEAEFIRLFPVTTNERIMQLFGLSFSTMQRFKRKYHLKKNMDVMRRKAARKCKRTCEQNGWYDSLKGKKPSQKCSDALRRKFESGFSPLRTLKGNNPARFRSVMMKRKKKRQELIRKERWRVNIGLSQQTHLHLPHFAYTRSQYEHRYSAYKRGYILGDIGDMSGERYTLFYDKKTIRSERFEQNCINDGFSIVDFRYASK